MKQTRFSPDPKRPYGFHDRRINGIRAEKGDLILSFEDGFTRIGGPDVRGYVVVEGVDMDLCEVIIQGKAGKSGGFRGEKLTVERFAEKYEGFRFEVTDEYYNCSRMQLVGWLWMPEREPRDMTVSVGYFSGDIVYNTWE